MNLNIAHFESHRYYTQNKKLEKSNVISYILDDFDRFRAFCYLIANMQISVMAVSHHVLSPRQGTTP